MRPAARIAALEELIGQLEGSFLNQGLPADVLVSQYFRKRRYAGSRDRREVSGLYYAYLRNREYVLWAVESALSKPDARLCLLGFLVLFGPEHLDAFFEGETYGPAPLTEDEALFVEKVRGLDKESAPWTVKANLPKWAVSAFEARFKTDVQDEAQALNEAANFDIRLNGIKASSDVINNLKKAIEYIEKNKYSNIGYTILDSVNLDQIPAYKEGEFEVQDQSAQIASLLVDARTGMTIADVCAGAGGKSLTISSLMKNSGQIFAFDISRNRLRACEKRIARGGHENIRAKDVPEAGETRLSAFAELAGACDRVLVDVPCTGTGTWRRSPDQRWRPTEAKLMALKELQYGMLVEASALVKPSGRLVYMTCSVLPDENEGIIEKFLASMPDWNLLPYNQIWSDVSTYECPHSLSSLKETLQLSPRQHGTDGFYVAVLECPNE